MTHVLATNADAYRVQATFLSAGEPFASEAYTMLLPPGHDPAAAAHALAGSSPYWNERVPDLSRHLLFMPCGTNDPGPPAGTARICDNIGRYLVLSTQHLRCATGDQLDCWAKPPAMESPLSVNPSLSGWLVPAQDVPGGACSLLPTEIPLILAFARSTGCSYVLFDYDVAPIADLPRFPW